MVISVQAIMVAVVVETITAMVCRWMQGTTVEITEMAAEVTATAAEVMETAAAEDTEMETVEEAEDMETVAEEDTETVVVETKEVSEIVLEIVVEFTQRFGAGYNGLSGGDGSYGNGGNGKWTVTCRSRLSITFAGHQQLVS